MFRIFARKHWHKGQQSLIDGLIALFQQRLKGLSGLANFSATKVELRDVERGFVIVRRKLCPAFCRAHSVLVEAIAEPDPGRLHGNLSVIAQFRCLAVFY